MYVRIKSYYEDGQFTGCEHLYSNCATLDEGIQKFRSEYPEHESCIVIAEHYEICKACGCVHWRGGIRMSCEFCNSFDFTNVAVKDNNIHFAGSNNIFI